ncbi:NADP-dependent oxidoreductase [Actinokineospora auranticolor]|uniref:Enoyl reductase (ER) domain-containing protein n=1 Tax=Actinokineospora auranticolor TaxID=155976 RepID=A0A2S6H0V6_9PSEU|nr:NADP-dependent oxidoreductase [Actinokineospora auranticolor]PPK71109.1 hypothetical protein CLV40_101298 [Actinokineospora auranticolor]
MSVAVHREVRLVGRPQGVPGPEHFAVVEVPVPSPGVGELLVRNRLMGVAAAMRTLMGPDVGLPMPGYSPGSVLWGPALGEVVEGDGFEPGTLVAHNLGWREYAVVPRDQARVVEPGLPEAAHLSQVSTAWFSVERAARVREGDTVFVTGAAGGVGTLAGQFARVRGAGRVIGSTGSAHKARYLVNELGFDGVVLRGAEPIETQLRAQAPEGVDAVIDNVGGEHLVAALAVARRGARIALVGSLSTQVGGGFSAPVRIDAASLILRSITLTGFSGADHLDARAEAITAFAAALRAGTVVFPHTRLSGLDQAPRALWELLEGRHTGAVVVEV